MKRLLIFGYGFIGKAFATTARAQGYDIVATARAPEKRQALSDEGIFAVDPLDETALAEAVNISAGLLITPAPDDAGCPAFAAVSAALTANRGKWIAYLSTTGVYGDREGGWVWEDSPLAPTSAEGRRRVLAEQQWRGLAQHAVNVFRLPGLYGPGRNVIERLMDGTARRIHKSGHVFSRLHHDDCATALIACLHHQTQGIFNLCDDLPAAADDVMTYAAQLTGLPLPPVIPYDDPNLEASMQRFYRDNKRVSNARAKAVLGWRPLYSTYHDGLNVLWSAMKAANQPSMWRSERTAMPSQIVRTIVITGASSGIGAEFARAYAALNWNVVLVARRLERLQALSKDLEAQYAIKATCIPADLSQRSDVEHLLNELKSQSIQPDGLVNNAGYSLARTFAATTTQAQLDFVEVCVTTPTLLAHALLPHMLEQNFGRIINVSSMVAFSPGAAGHTLYPAAKAYMLKFSRSLAAEVHRQGINVTALCPGTTDSEFQQANGMTEVLKTKPPRLSQSAQSVVNAAIRANENGQEVIVTGLINKIAVAAMTLLPDGLITPLIRWGASRYQIHD